MHTTLLSLQSENRIKKDPDNKWHRNYNIGRFFGHLSPLLSTKIPNRISFKLSRFPTLQFKGACFTHGLPHSAKPKQCTTSLITQKPPPYIIFGTVRCIRRVVCFLIWKLFSLISLSSHFSAFSRGRFYVHYGNTEFAEEWNFFSKSSRFIPSSLVQ